MMRRYLCSRRHRAEKGVTKRRLRHQVIGPNALFQKLHRLWAMFRKQTLSSKLVARLYVVHPVPIALI